MENKTPAVKFALKKIITEQFAIIEESYSKEESTSVSTGLRIYKVIEQKIVGVSLSIKFTHKEKQQPFLLIEVSCLFRIESDTWDQFFDLEKQEIQLPRGFSLHLVMLTMGTVRGVLHAKTENTPFNRFVIPTINVTDLVQDAISI